EPREHPVGAGRRDHPARENRERQRLGVVFAVHGYTGRAAGENSRFLLRGEQGVAHTSTAEGGPCGPALPPPGQRRTQVRRLFWFGAGVAAGVAVTRKINETTRRATPAGMAEQLGGAMRDLADS